MVDYLHAARNRGRDSDDEDGDAIEENDAEVEGIMESEGDADNFELSDGEDSEEEASDSDVEVEHPDGMVSEKISGNGNQTDNAALVSNEACGRVKMVIELLE